MPGEEGLAFWEICEAADTAKPPDVGSEPMDVDRIPGDNFVAAFRRRQDEHRINDIGGPGTPKQQPDVSRERLRHRFDECRGDKRGDPCVPWASPRLGEYRGGNGHRRPAAGCERQKRTYSRFAAFERDESAGV